MTLLLEAVDVTAPSRWRWLLRDEETGGPLADHWVQLGTDTSGRFRFADLYAYERAYAAPDRRIEDGARFARLAGEWAGRELLGESIGAAILAAAPTTVRVRVPAAIEQVLLWPLELSHVAGKPLAVRGDVAFVYDIEPDAPERRKAVVGETLRMLAVFSQPTRTSVLALRRERYALTRLIRQMAARQRAHIQLQVVQYGVTRDRLAQIAEDGEGWDVLHVSGHGTGGVLVLEHDDGTPDLVRVDDFVRLLSPARFRAKLAVVSVCESAADATAQTMRLLGLADQAEQVEAVETQEAMGGATTVGAVAASTAGLGDRAASRSSAEIPGLARSLVRELDCAVVAMRYPVADEFAIAYGDAFYEHLFGRRQPADVAASRALAEAAGSEPSAGRPPLCLATPGVFGARAIGLSLPVPAGRPVIDPADQRMVYFPPEPVRFVGRAAAMARASAALAPRSAQGVILLHGMAGAGKTSAALELAYRHAENFAAAAWWQAPTRQEEWQTALADFANRLDIQLGEYGFRMSGAIASEAALDAFLPRVSFAMESAGVLLVLDNLETLLTPDGRWRDARWAKLLTALTDHQGESRVILTSRTAPAVLGRALKLPVHALSLDESVALARELPNLRALLHADPGPVREVSIVPGDDWTSVQADRERVRRVLRITQGHPKLMELADAAAADRSRLDAQLAAAEEAANTQVGVGQLEAFIREGESTLEPDQFLSSLAGWTETALGVLSPEARLMAEFVVCLEDDDRRSDLISTTWAKLWPRLGRSGDPPAPEPLLDALAVTALIEAELILVTDRDAAAGRGGVPPSAAYLVHPGVAAVISAATGADVRQSADAELAAFWMTVSDWARQRAAGEDSALVVRAGLAATPYLLRQEEWRTAGFLLEQAVIRNESPGLVQTVLPSLRRIAAATGAPADAGVLADVLRQVDSGEAERLLRGALDAAAGTGDNWVASASAGRLFNLLRDAGRLREALAMADELTELNRRAGLGPWSQLANEALRLQVLGLMGEHARVLAEVDRLRAAMAGLPGRGGADEAAEPWNVREAILDAGHASALATEEWPRCLELNAEIMASKRERGAGVHEVTRTRFNDAGPLIRLERLAEAGRLLAECQQVFEDHADTANLANVLSTRADLEDSLGRPEVAADLERAALRLSYAHPEPRDIAISHYNLADYLEVLGYDRVAQRAHRLAAGLIYRLAGMAQYLARTVRALAGELRADDGTDPSLPSTAAQVIAIAEQTEGVRLSALLAALQPDLAAVEAGLAELLATAMERDQIEADTEVSARFPAEARSLREEPALFVELVIAAVRGDDLARNSLDQALPVLLVAPETAVLARWVTRLLSGAEPLPELSQAADDDFTRYIATRVGQVDRITR